MRFSRMLLAGLMSLLLVFPVKSLLADNPPPPPGTNPRQVEIKVFLQGLYDSEENGGEGGLRKAMDYDGGPTPRFPAGDFAEEIKVELHEAGNYGNPVVDGWVKVNQGGIASFNLSADYDGNYYITIKNRNHIETVSAVTITFAGTEKVEYDFTTAASQAYGDNQIELPGGHGHFGIYAGDVTQSGETNPSDILNIRTAYRSFVTGYVPEDIAGSGEVTPSDILSVRSAYRNFIEAEVPN